MQQSKARVFLQEIANIWTNGTNAQLEKYYAQDFVGNYYGNHINFNDLVQRLNYMNTHQHKRKIDFKEIIVDDNKIAVLFHYAAIDDMEGAINTHIMAIYHLNSENQIVAAWAFADRAVKYTH